MIDLHCHTKYSRHGTGEIRDYVSSAAQKGIAVLGFSEHLPFPSGFHDPIGDAAMLPECLPQYLKDVEDAKNNSQIVVLSGSEVDFMPEFLDETKRALEGLKLDYRIGSVHFIDGWNFDHSNEYFRGILEKKYKGRVKKLINDYFDLVEGAVRSGLFDIVGHLDLIKKFNKDGMYFNEMEDYYRTRAIDILDLIKRNGLVVEINTAGMDKKVGIQYPSRWILRRCHENGIPITMGSDAHKPEEAGRYFDMIKLMLKEIGYEKLVYFHERVIKDMPLTTMD